MSKLLKRKVSFIDADKHRVILDVEITNRNKYPEFTISGRVAGSGGQCQDSIKPRTDAQTILLHLWDKWHLNGTHAGTPEQEEAIEQWEKAGNKYDYTEACEHLKTINLYEVKLPDGTNYQYGHGWQQRILPENFDKAVNQALDTIEAEEKEYAANQPEVTGDEAVLQQMEEYAIDEDSLAACKAYLACMGSNTTLKDFEESYSGTFTDDAEFAQDQAESIGAVDEKATWPNNCIDWEIAAREIMMGYTEQDGFYFRNI